MQGVFKTGSMEPGALLYYAEQEYHVRVATVLGIYRFKTSVCQNTHGFETARIDL